MTRTEAGETRSTTTGAAASTSSASGGEASKPPKVILVDMGAALRSVHDYSMQGAITQDHQRLRFELATTSATSLDFAFSIGDAAVELINVPGASYIRGNLGFWRAHAGARGARFANRWIQVPSQSARGLTSSLGPLAPSTLSRCLVEDHGTLRLGATTTIDGRAAILLKDAGDLPGSSRGVLAVAGTGAPYPLRYTSTGGQRAGGHIDVCNNGKASDARGTISFSQFGQVAPIQPPKGAEQIGPAAPTA